MRDEPLVLGIETSCDETGVGIVRGETLLADAIASSVDEHARFGGVVPEVASRAHLEAMVPTIERACATSRGQPARPRRHRRHVGPGLAGALMVGVAAAKALALVARHAALRRQPPRAHVAVDIVEHGPLPEPTMALLVSGGHSSLLLVPDVTHDVRTLGATIDDAAGEAFDKVARVLGLPFPGGPHIDRAAREGSGRHRLPARAHHGARHGAAPLRLLVLGPEDRRRPLGRGTRGGGGAGAGRRRRRELPGGRRRRADPQGRARLPRARRRAPADRRRRRGQLAAAGAGRRSAATRPASRCGCRGRGCAPTTARWSRRSGAQMVLKGRAPSDLDLPADSSMPVTEVQA